MRKSIATVCLSGTLEEKLTAIAAAGFDGVEIFENDLLASPLSPERVRDRTAELGLSLDLFQPFRDFEAVPGDLLARNLRRAEKKFAVMERLGADLLLVCSSVSPAALDDDALAAEQLRLLAERAAAHGIRIAYEALAWGRHVNTYDHAWRIVRQAGHPALGICLDSFHILSRGSDPKGIEEIPGEKIFFLQLADAPLMAMDVLQWSRHYRCFPGQGGLDVTGLLEHVLRTGYDGPLSLEVFNDVFRQGDTARTAVDALRSLIALEEAADRTDLPAPVVPTGFAFAELAAGGGELPALLTALGFARTGRHHSKPVELWERGEARIVLNSGLDATTGHPEAALAAIGLETPDPAASTGRARALLAPVLPRHRAVADAPLDAVAAPDSTELFFCRTEHPDHPSWTGDFTPRARAASPAGITHIDHVALTQPRHHFDEASLFYRAVLGLRPHDSLELADPYGLLRSRAVSNADGSVRLALNVAQIRPDSGPSGSLRQHIALHSRDIVATARRLRELGAPPLPIPGNYYDDLEARHELDPGLHRTLRELRLLYDQDDGGSFLHLYTATVGRVFFEVVQRIDGYQGYGAANAPVRLAAQHARVR
ncbi:sugar phosphate isomerase/epimerase and 4-hydroxyphenylpyruvate domain-containing protein [Streptomyces malaysiensis subsp. malaysiensis]|uniref:3-dehydroshikimate dehydratase n=1 Tax=Streptomyces malaysiensis TaxID=92644 RepID=A0ABX6WA56_STRMQ|nr:MULTISPECIES: sugar phosphate isomerase/epimerase and 4-hydroxyphenylpyruvate domain-containing protein [Streptomyces]QPI58332.1 sugar phosphate isomerase/epimerase and 4-hydroxyphenylpyruvate domain-containing protein [Streptomyces solisilvae]UHH19921.1 sugar phosphate isomerase/epimerase and 4-hydroxyphenylpyruvate domain-containing protein [Streptomyces sp. HNM0561]